MIPAYSSIYNFGHKEVANIFDGDVTVEEKIDGSQFSFSYDGTKINFRSKNQPIDPENCPEMFKRAVNTVLEFTPDDLQINWVYRAEVLDKPKHNTLCYDRVPKGNLIIYDIDRGDQDYLTYDEKVKECNRLGLECVPRFGLNTHNLEEFQNLLERTSVLGGSKIEGFVVKNYGLYGRDKKVLMAKFVSERFKELNSKGRKKEAGSNITQALGLYLKSEARWEKAVQHLREQGLLDNSTKDIAPLLKELNLDILKECEEEIKQKLFDKFWKKIVRVAVAGFPEWYKQKLLASQFKEEVCPTLPENNEIGAI